ncbi:DUF6397 family protein [Streptomyces mangrovisoli]|uniref:Uncharacterized protein n=1 Tax=Streptomyces mangrovisoli TaxID=1428628 RepID=A0A1J4P318_9ACTN|nr:DUF6397 family protein [Streptomyces mangrovisoli]OIJ68610.1 hypothetical protein WN71_007490 [Streptomyces mangrovisoli]
MPGNTTLQPQHLSYAPSRAARELELKRGEFDLAVHLGRVRTLPEGHGAVDRGGGRRVARAEIERLRAQDGFPTLLRESVRAVGTREAAGVLDVPPTRFTRLARLGLFAPVTFYVNRYRVVVWLYLADELRQFAAGAHNRSLLGGRIPAVLRDQLGTGLDLRPRNWRGRHLGFLLRHADDPWRRAGAVAALLDPEDLADIVPDPGERAQLLHLRPEPPVHAAPGSPAAQLIETLTTAQDADEIAWLAADLTQALDEARADRPAPRPAAAATTAHVPAPSLGIDQWLSPGTDQPLSRGDDQSLSPGTAPIPSPGTGRALSPRTAQAPCPVSEQPSARCPERGRGLLARLLRRHPRTQRPAAR